MPAVLIFIIILLAVAVLTLAVWARKEAKKHDTTAKEELVGICKLAIETASQKEERKQKALAMFADKPELSNSEIRAALGVSSRTAVRYLDELEKEGKVEQAGKIGHAVTYRRK
jgi:predicted HTH transcriptional regulator